MKNHWGEDTGILYVLGMSINLHRNRVFYNKKYIGTYDNLKSFLTRKYRDIVKDHLIKVYNDGGDVKFSAAFDTVIERVITEQNEDFKQLLEEWGHC